MFRSWEAEGVLKCSLWRVRFGSYCGKPLAQKIFNWQGLAQLKCVLTSFKLFHARVSCFLLHLFLGSFISVMKLTLEESGMISPTINKRWLHPWIKTMVITLHCQPPWLTGSFTSTSSAAPWSTRPAVTSLLSISA